MKPLFLLLLLALAGATQAQLKSSTQNQCSVLTVDLLDGKVNSVEANYTAGQIKRVLPCFTSEEAEVFFIKTRTSIFIQRGIM